MREIRSAPAKRAATPVRFDGAEAERLSSFGNIGIPVRLIRVAVRYWASYPGDIDAEITAAEAAEETAEAAWRRERDLLAG